MMPTERLASIDPADVAALAVAAAIFGDPHAPDHVHLALEHGRLASRSPDY